MEEDRVEEDRVELSMWLSDFKWRKDHLIVRRTGVRVPLNAAIVGEFFAWFAFYLALLPVRAWHLARHVLHQGVRQVFNWPMRPGPQPQQSGLTLAFLPHPPRPWFLLWAVALMAGARFTGPAAAQAVFYFEDQTAACPPAGARVHDDQILVNFDCADVSKSRVARIFAEVFGYPLAIHPGQWTGPAVEKSELNGTHDGQIIHCPCPQRPGRVYQRLVDNTAGDGLAEDIRCPTVFGTIPVVFLKRRPVGQRFANANTHVRMTEPEAVLSPDERQKLAVFAQAMGLGWGGMDVLRDRQSGRIYVVDVNKTDMGPPTALGLVDKLRATHRLAGALRTALSAGRGQTPQ